jgi:electron transport complex protein RnfC
MLRRITIDWSTLPNFEPLESPFAVPRSELRNTEEISVEAFPEFIEQIGLVGMGGSGFNTADKIRAASGAHTLVINGVECEPGITIDQTVLLHHSNWVKAGADASAKAVGAKRIVLAVKNKRSHMAKLKNIYPNYDIVPFPNRYPAGAEKLIIKKLNGRMPPTGSRPHQLGYLVQNVVSLRAIGRALLDGISVVERPLTLAMPSQKFYKNIVAPVGLPMGQLLENFDLPYNEEKHLIASSGLLMGYEVFTGDFVEKTTTSLIILERQQLELKERACIRCGACNSTCPLGLHPFTLVDRIEQKNTDSSALQTQLNECFLCGACSAVCPSHIPLVQTLMEGKRCLP